MVEKDKEKVESVINDIRIVHENMCKRESYKTFLNFSKTIFNNDGVIERKNKNLIALAVSITINCEPCILFHIRDAFANGAREEEIVEAIEIGFKLGGGPSIIKSSFAFKVLEYHREFGKLY